MRISDWSSDVCSSDLAETAAGQICTGPARHQPRTSAEVQRENERDVGIAEAVAGEIGRYAKSGVGRRPELVEHYETPGHKFGTLRHLRRSAGQSAVLARGQGVEKDSFQCDRKGVVLGQRVMVVIRFGGRR